MRPVALFALLTLLSAACAGGLADLEAANLPVSSEGPANVGPAEDAAVEPGGDRTLTTSGGTSAGSAGPAPGGGSGSSERGIRSEGSGPASEDSAPEQQDAGPYRAPPGVTEDSIAIGLWRPQSGPYEAVTKDLPAAIEARFDEVNEAGGIHGRELVLKQYDDGFGDASLIQNNAKVAKDEVFSWIGSTGEGSSMLAPLADEFQVPLQFINIAEEIGVDTEWGFAAIPYWERQARTVVPAYVAERLDGVDRTLGVIYTTDQIGERSAEAFRAYAGEFGLTIEEEQSISASPNSCTNEVSNLQTAGVEVVVLIGGPVGAICVFRDSRVVGFDPDWVGMAVSWEFNLTASATGGATDGIETLTAKTTLETAEGQRYQELMRQNGHSDAAESDIPLVVFGIAGVLIEALETLGPEPTRAGFVDVMETSLSGFTENYLPPLNFAPNDRSGPRAVRLVVGRDTGWETSDATWRESF